MILILETERLLLRQYTLDDVSFVLRLVNEPSWLANIGDRNVHNLEDAEKFLLDGPLKSYEVNGYGFCVIMLKETGTPIGVCGLAKRPFLDHPDIGYALLPEFTGNGYAIEIATATLKYAFSILGIPKVVAITTQGNARSIHLLNKLGLKFEKKIVVDGDELLMFGAEAS